MAIGKFQGVIAATTPTACLTVKTRLSFANVGITSPYKRRASSANQSMKDAPYSTSPFASANGLPCSRVISFARSSWLSRISWFHLRRSVARSFAVLPCQAFCAALAASTARVVSSAAISATSTMCSPVAGLITANVLPESAATHSPFT